MIKTDIIIIGAGPAGLFAVFEAGLLKLKCHLIDILPAPGGQCSELYPKKPIYDIPGHPEILAADLVKNLLDQCSQFQPGFTLGERAEKISKNSKGLFTVVTDKGTTHQAPVVAIAGGGDSALDWTIELANIASNVTLIHRRNEFRGTLDSVEKVQELKNKNKIKLITPAEVVSLMGDDKLKSVEIKIENSENITLNVDYFIPLFGLTPKLGPINDWGLEIEKKSIKVDNTLNYQTNVPGIFAIGDINTYPGKLKLILCGFHEAAMMCHSAYKIINPDKKLVLQYTTVSGVSGFDGSIKKAQPPVRRSID